MSKKIIQIDPNKRLSEESLNEIKAFVNGLTAESSRGLFLLATVQDEDNKDDYTIFRQAHGIDWELCGILRPEVEKLCHWYYETVLGEELSEYVDE